MPIYANSIWLKECTADFPKSTAHHLDVVKLQTAIVYLKDVIVLSNGVEEPVHQVERISKLMTKKRMKLILKTCFLSFD